MKFSLSSIQNDRASTEKTRRKIIRLDIMLNLKCKQVFVSAFENRENYMAAMVKNERRIRESA